MPASIVTRIAVLCAALLSTEFLVSGRAAAECANSTSKLGVSRTVKIDAAAGPVYGHLTKQPYQRDFLGPKEVVLTFDDGPMPAITRQILDTLDQFCTKATFFTVGQMAIAYPDMLREILSRGHTVGTHTWSHPLNIARLPIDRARDQIESGFAAASLAAGQPIAPFFRFPGLSDSNPLVDHLRRRGIATFSVDVVSNDSYIHDAGRLAALTLSRLDKENGGIMLFHDIKLATARALPTILAEIKARGFRVVHMVPKQPVQPDAGYVAALQDSSSFRKSTTGKRLMAITDTMPAPTPVSRASPPSSSISTAATPPAMPHAQPLDEATPLAAARRSAPPAKASADAEPSRKHTSTSSARAPVPKAARSLASQAAANAHRPDVNWISDYQNRARGSGQ